MTQWFDSLPFRIGTTSYIIPDDILPNVRFLADRVKDVELVLFDIDDYCNIPDERQCGELKAIAAAHDLSYTVHLPLNLDFSETGVSLSIEKALKVINGTRSLDPHAYVCHLECKNIPAGPGFELEQWQKERIRAVNALADISGIRAGFAIENLESYPIAWNEPVVRACGTHVTLDIGHLFVQKLDPVPVIRKWLPLTSVIHLHGVGSRDHQSLKFMSQDVIRAVLAEIIRMDYHGVLTLEIFNEADLRDSMEMIRECL